MGSWFTVLSGGAGAATTPTYYESNGGAADGGPTFNQVVPVDTVDHKITLTAYIDPNSKFDSPNSRYVVPVAGIYRYSVYAQVDNSTGAAALMEILVNIYVNGVASVGHGTAVPNPPGARWWPSFTGLLSLSLNDQVEVWANMNDGTNTGNVIFTDTVFSIELVQ